MPDSTAISTLDLVERRHFRQAAEPYNPAAQRNLRVVNEKRSTLLIIRVIMFVGIMIAGLVFVSMFNLRQEVITAAGQSLERRAALFADEAEHAFDSVDLMQQVVANHIRATGVRTPAELNLVMGSLDSFEDLRGRLEALPQLEALNIYDANGDRVVSSRVWPPDPSNVADREDFEEFRANRKMERYISPPRFSKTTHTWVMSLERQLIGPDGEFLGMLQSSVNLEYFFNLYQQMLTGPGDVLSLYRDDGTLLVRAPARPEVLGRKSVEASLAELLPKGGPASVLLARGSLLDGEPRVLAGHRLKNYPFIVKTGVATQAALAGWRTEAAYAGAAVMVIEAALFWVTRLLRRQSMARIKLTRALERQGDAERRRLNAARELETLIASMPGVLIRLQMDSKKRLVPTYVAPSVANLTGFSREVVTSMRWLREHISLDDLKLLRQREKEALAHGQADVTISFRHRNGGMRRVHGKLSAQSAHDGRTQLVVIWTDITTDSEMAARMAHTAKLATLGELATGMAHELNQPLATISMAAENAQRMLHSGPDAIARVEPKLDLIINLVARAAVILDHMRVFGRTGDVPTKAVDVRSVIATAETLVTNKLAFAKARLVVSVPDDLPLVLAKPVPLEQVLLNLIANACDAYCSEHARLAVTDRLVRVIAWADQDQIHLCVADHAGGILPSVLPRIFEPFFTTKDVGEGTGLGLSISYGIVSDMDGTITASNEHGGAVFHITLPAYTAPAELNDSISAC